MINGVFVHTQLQQSSIHAAQDQSEPVISTQSTLGTQVVTGPARHTPPRSPANGCIAVNDASETTT
jgi:hypothetical protein